MKKKKENGKKKGYTQNIYSAHAEDSALIQQFPHRSFPIAASTEQNGGCRKGGLWFC